MKMTTGRIANPRKRRAPAKRKTVTVAKRRRRRANPGHMRAVIPQTMVTRAHYAPEVREANPRRRKAAGHSSGGIFVSPSGRTLTRRANPRGPGVVAGVSITETALMVLSGGAAAFAGAVAVRFCDEKMRNKWGRIGLKSGLALVVGFCGMKAAESQAMGGRIVLPIAIGFAAPMIASAIDDIFDKPITTSAFSLLCAHTSSSQVFGAGAAATITKRFSSGKFVPIPLSTFEGMVTIAAVASSITVPFGTMSCKSFSGSTPVFTTAALCDSEAFIRAAFVSPFVEETSTKSAATSSAPSELMYLTDASSSRLLAAIRRATIRSFSIWLSRTCLPIFVYRETLDLASSSTLSPNTDLPINIVAVAELIIRMTKAIVRRVLSGMLLIFLNTLYKTLCSFMVEYLLTSIFYPLVCFVTIQYYLLKYFATAQS